MTFLINLFKQFCGRILQVLTKCKLSDNLKFLEELLKNFVLLDIEKRETKYLREQVESLEKNLADNLDALKDETILPVTNVKDQIYRPFEMHLQKEKEFSLDQEHQHEFVVEPKQLRLSGSGVAEYLEKNVNSGDTPNSPNNNKIKVSMDSIDQLGDFSKQNLEFNLNNMRHEAEVRKDSERNMDR